MENSNKRPLEEECQYLHTETKKPKASQVISTTSHPKSSKEIVGLEDLCDDIIVYLFKFLSHDELAKMALICPNLFRISNDWTLWKKPRFEKFDQLMEYIYLGYLKNNTTEIFISSDDVQSPNHSVSHNFLMRLETMCPELQHLTLRNQIFDANEINVRVLHRKLKSLTIDNTTIENIPDSSSYLCGINNSCPDLEKIIMTNNDWFLPNCLYALAKLERLHYLSLAGCKQFKDCIPYASITAITGFKSLHTLDLRFTPISDHELVCFQRLTSLKSVLLESPSYMNHERDATITDLGLAGFCTVAFEFHYPYIQILIDRRGGVNLRRVQDRHGDLNRCNIEYLYVRNYPKVTDAFLKTAARNCPHLKSLDITGSCCTSEEIEYYKASRPRTKTMDGAELSRLGLHRFGKTESDSCALCGAAPYGAKHAVFQCDAFHRWRAEACVYLDVDQLLSENLTCIMLRSNSDWQIVSSLIGRIMITREREERARQQAPGGAQ